MSDHILLADGAIDLRLGDCNIVLGDVRGCDEVITDPPFSDRTHAGQRVTGKDPRYTGDAGTLALAARGLGFHAFDEEKVSHLTERWSPRFWFCCFTSHDLVGMYERAHEAGGRYVFAPISCVQRNRNVRLGGDGPSNWTDHLVVARTTAASKWGALPGAYVGPPFDPGENMLDRSARAVPGGKPLWLMRAIVRDYTRPGDLVVDPFMGGGTTALACAIEGRRCISSEIDPATFAKAVKRLRRGFSVDMFANAEAAE